MIPVIVLLSTFLFSEPVCGKQQPTLTTVASSSNSVGDPLASVQLDPQLRRALLRALTQLENEAQYQNPEEQFTSNRTGDEIDEVQESVTNDLRRLIGNFHSDSTYDSDHKVVMEDSEDGKEILQDEDRYREHISEKYREEYSESKYPNQENFERVADYVSSSNMQPLKVPTTSEEPSELGVASSVGEPTQAAIFFQNAQPEFQSKTTEMPQEPRNNHPATDVVASPAEIQNMRDVLPVENPQSSDILLTPTTPSVVTKSGAEESQVSIFRAPLVVAFTLHQDSSGLPTSVIPLLQPQPTAPTSPGDHQQKLFLLREQELLHKTRLLEQQLAQFQQQRLQQQYFLQQQNRQAFLVPQNHFVPAVGSSRRPQRHETGTGIVEFQPSIEFPLNHNNGHLTSTSSTQAQRPARHPQQNSNLFFQQSPNFFSASTLQQENGLIPPPPLPLQQPPSFIQQQFSSAPGSHLQNLLYQAGVPDTPQEDLNIVSKVLSLNHLRRHDDMQSPPSKHNSRV